METTTTTNAPAVYVGTYAKYAKGSLAGAWLALADFETYGEFLAACRKLHSDEECPELMFQDFSNVPAAFCNELDAENAFKYAVNLDEIGDLEAFGEFVEYHAGDFAELLCKFAETYIGYFATLYEFGVYMAEVNCIFAGDNEIFEMYFDFEQYGRDLAFDCTNCNGYYFFAA